jgi:ribosomal protein L37AE/L43A
MTVKIEEIIEEARTFECCPYCGNTDIRNFYCRKCERVFGKPARALLFAEYLKNKYIKK